MLFANLLVSLWQILPVHSSVYQNFFFGIAFVIVTYGSISDLKTREVPDILNYGLIVAGFGLRLICSVYAEDSSIFIAGILGFGIAFLLSMIMFYTGQWGGGDAKMMMGLGVILGFHISMNDFFVAFLMNSLWFGALYGLVWSFVLTLINSKKVMDEIKRHGMYYGIALPLAVISMVVCIFTFTVGISKLGSFIIFSIAAAVLIVAFILILVGWIRVVEQVCFVATIPTEKLTEGDWIRDEIVTNKKVIIKKGMVIQKAHLDKLQSFESMLKQKIHIRRKWIGVFPILRLVALSSLQKSDVLMETVVIGKKVFRGILSEDDIALIDRERRVNTLLDVKIERRFFGFKHVKKINATELRVGDRVLSDVVVAHYFCGPLDLGVSREQIVDLQKSDIKLVTIRTGIPFVPSFLGALVITQLVGNLLWIILW
jgi:Flp pilus assembly protein protease CpaA